ncbi:sugar transferase [Roseivirga sp. BDSF3-8]|uniref:sugar transferase n=1 Tax=Roseivirga sp. BDSF3-8 TaxID=3241598 RepID=UPI003531F1EC
MFKIEGNDTASPTVKVSPSLSKSVGESQRKLLFVGNSGRFVCESLTDYNYNCIFLSDPAKAYSWLENRMLSATELPDAILCDLKLSNGDAFSLFDKLKDHARLSQIPFIIVSEKCNNEEKVNALKKGIDDFYSITDNPEDIHNRILFLQDLKKQRMNQIPVGPDQQYKMPIAKRLFDVIVSGTALLFALPVMLLIALMIKLESRGKVFYVSKRAGSGYQVFDFYKFRSMRENADAELQKLVKFNQYGGKSSFVKIDNDPRVTRLGKFLRNTSLDEIPQLINVLKGDMSIVGNRPLPLYEAEMLTTDLWSKRFLAPAGITGLWQVTKRGRKEMSERERKELDVAYANHSSFWMDMKLILKTIPALWQKESV